MQDTEIKFGYAVTGEVATSAIWANAGARAGDELLLTKAIGTGVISTALKFERAPAAAIDAAVASMTTTNRAAAEALRSLPAGAVHGCTDITGFGLIGHASEMGAASAVTLEITASAVPRNQSDSRLSVCSAASRSMKPEAKASNLYVLATWRFKLSDRYCVITKMRRRLEWMQLLTATSTRR